MKIEWENAKKSIILPLGEKGLKMLGGNLDDSNSELKNWMKLNKINFDEGELINIGNKKVHVVPVRTSISARETYMITDRSDFGTMLEKDALP